MLLYKLYCHIQGFLFRKSLLAGTADTFRLKLQTLRKKWEKKRSSFEIGSKLALTVCSKQRCVWRWVMLGFAWVKGVSGDGGGQDQGKCPRALQFAPRAASVRASASFLRGRRKERKKTWGSRGWGRGEGRGGGGGSVAVAVRWDPLAAASTPSLHPLSSTAPPVEKKGPEWRADPFQRGNPTHTKLWKLLLCHVSVSLTC